MTPGPWDVRKAAFAGIAFGVFYGLAGTRGAPDIAVVRELATSVVIGGALFAAVAAVRNLFGR